MGKGGGGAACNTQNDVLNQVWDQTKQRTSFYDNDLQSPTYVDKLESNKKKGHKYTTLATMLLVNEN